MHEGICGREVYFYFSLYTTLYFHIFILYDIQFFNKKEFIERTTDGLVGHK